MATVNNTWITLSEQRNGVTVQRKYAGHTNRVKHEDDTVQYCILEYWERELYPNGEVIKTELKTYTLVDLAYTEVSETQYMAPLAVLSGFIASLGQPYIVDASRETLMSVVALPLNVENGYPLRRDTREILNK